MEKIKKLNDILEKKIGKGEIVFYQLMIWVGEGYRIENSKFYEFQNHIELTVKSAYKYAIENKIKTWVELVARDENGDDVERQIIFTINGKTLDNLQKKIDKYNKNSDDTI